MMDRYSGKNHVLYTDNSCMSPIHSKYLLEKEGPCATVRAKRKYWADFGEGQWKGQVEVKETENMLAILWMDNKLVNVLNC